MKDDTDLPPYVLGLGDDIVSADAGSPFARIEQCRQDAEESGLATAVRAKQAKDLAAADFERESIEGTCLSVGVPESLDLEDAAATIPRRSAQGVTLLAAISPRRTGR